VPKLSRPALKGASELLRQRSLSEGLWNGRKGWMAVGAVVWGVRGVRWALHREERVLMREVLEPGQTVVVREVQTVKPRRQRKAAAAARKVAAKAAKAAEVQAKLDAKRAKSDAKKRGTKAEPAPVAKIEVFDEPPKLSRKDRKAIKRAAREAA